MLCRWGTALYLAAMNLSLDRRHVRDACIVTCTGRIVAGAETQYLREQVTELTLESRCIILQLAGVSFLDSSGLGALMQLRSATKSKGGELVLCAVPHQVKTALSMTNLLQLFRVCETEEQAFAAGPGCAIEESRSEKDDCILCVSDTAEVRTYLRTVLSAANFNSLCCESLYDAKVFLKTNKPKLIILGPRLLSIAPDLVGQFKALAPTIPIIELNESFSEQEAGDAGHRLLDRVVQLLRANAAPGGAS